MLSLSIQCVFMGLISGCISVLTALGIMVIMNVTNVLNLAQGEFVMLGGMFAVTLLVMGLPAPIAFLAAILITVIIGVLFQRLAIEPLKGASPAITCIATIGVSLALSTGALMAWGWQPRTFAPFTGGEPISFLGAIITHQGLWIIGLTIPLVAALHLFFKYTLIGRALNATALDEGAARLMGINPSTMAIVAFAMAAALGAFAGIITTPVIMTSFSLGLMVTLKALIVALVAEFKANRILIFGIVLGIMEGFAKGFISSGFGTAIALLIMILVMIAMPRFTRIEA